MYALYIIGRNLERFYGHGRFLLLYFLGAFGGNVLSYVLSPGQFIGRLNRTFRHFGSRRRFHLWQPQALWPAAHQTDDHQSGRGHAGQPIVRPHPRFFNVDSWGHIGGILAGIFFAWKAGPILQIKGQPPFFEMVDTRKKNEVLLTTLHRPGRFSLSSLSCLPSLAKLI